MKAINVSKRDIGIFDNLQKGTTFHKRGALIFQILLLNYNFKNFIVSIRRSLRIPPNGLNVNNDKDWKRIKKYIYPGCQLRDSIAKARLVVSDKIENRIKEFIAIEKILESIPSLGLFDDIVNSIIIEYAIINDVRLFGYQTGFLMTTDYSDEDMENEIEIRFFAGATIEEMIDFIKNNKEEINILQERIIGDRVKQRIKLTKNLERNIYIFNRYNEILNMPKEKRNSRYIELRIANELSEKGILMDEGSIKATIDKVRKLIKKSNRVLI